ARTEIATNGDVILVVGPQGKKIRVCSFILQNASTYFRAMFGPHFAEGKDLKSNDPKEMLMPGDNANALEIICNIMHLQNDAVPQSLSPSDIFDIAIAADKFDSVIALKHVSTLWLKPKGVESISELGYLMAAAYILDNAQAFSEITLSMVFCHTGSYLPLADQVIGLIDFVPWKTLYLLEEQRNWMRTELQQILFDGSTDAGSDETNACTCAWSSRHSLAHTELLRHQELQPLQILNITISRVIERLEQMKDPVISNQWVPCMYRWHRNPCYRERRGQSLRKLQGSNGLCIDCVRSGTVPTNQICRIKH
ncbi:hypothetical protein BKA66DRAFT_434194, partial [Pyrenochaeta sp. MPI-SDFR-AT-0127]